MPHGKRRNTENARENGIPEDGSAFTPVNSEQTVGPSVPKTVAHARGDDADRDYGNTAEQLHAVSPTTKESDGDYSPLGSPQNETSHLNKDETTNQTTRSGGYYALFGTAPGISRRHPQREEEGAVPGKLDGDNSEENATDSSDPDDEQGQPTNKRSGERKQLNAAFNYPKLLAVQKAFEMKAPKLYSFHSTYMLEWPSLTVDWNTHRRFTDPERDYNLQYVYVGTQAFNGSRNYVQVKEVAIPLVLDPGATYHLFGDDRDPGDDLERYEIDPGKKYENVKGHCVTEQTITMDDPVLKLRAMPQNTNIIAVKTTTGYIGVYDTSKATVDDDEDRELAPLNQSPATKAEARLRGHRTGGFGLAWNVVEEGVVASGSDDGIVNVYNVEQNLSSNGRQTGEPNTNEYDVQPYHQFDFHKGPVTDVSWHATQPHLLVSSSLDRSFCLWDMRTDKHIFHWEGVHTRGTTGAQFNPTAGILIATCGEEGAISFWDLRHPGAETYIVGYHSDSVYGIQWSPFSESVLASYGADRRVVLWDLARINLKDDYNDNAPMPKEVSFVHAGHLQAVTDFGWSTSPGDDWLCVSTDKGNGLQFYRPNHEVVMDFQPPEQYDIDEYKVKTNEGNR